MRICSLIDPLEIGVVGDQSLMYQTALSEERILTQLGAASICVLTFVYQVKPLPKT